MRAKAFCRFALMLTCQCVCVYVWDIECMRKRERDMETYIDLLKTKENEMQKKYRDYSDKVKQLELI